jgi:hypothetical protein
MSEATVRKYLDVSIVWWRLLLAETRRVGLSETTVSVQLISHFVIGKVSNTSHKPPGSREHGNTGCGDRDNEVLPAEDRTGNTRKTVREITHSSPTPKHLSKNVHSTCDLVSGIYFERMEPLFNTTAPLEKFPPARATVLFTASPCPLYKRRVPHVDKRRTPVVLVTSGHDNPSPYLHSRSVVHEPARIEPAHISSSELDS